MSSIVPSPPTGHVSRYTVHHAGPTTTRGPPQPAPRPPPGPPPPPPVPPPVVRLARLPDRVARLPPSRPQHRDRVAHYSPSGSPRRSSTSSSAVSSSIFHQSSEYSSTDRLANPISSSLTRLRKSS